MPKTAVTCSNAECRKKYIPKREWQRFCRTECRMAWNFRKRQQILHSSGQVTKLLVKRKPRNGGWRRINGRDVYVPPGYKIGDGMREASETLEELGL